MNNRRPRWLGLILLLGLVIGLWLVIFSLDFSPKLKVAFLDVGQGDAILIEGPNGNQILIDGGSGRQVLRALGRELPFYDRTINLVIATHPDADHIGGLPFVFDRYRVLGIMDNGQTETAEDFVWFDKGAKKETPTRLKARGGQTVDLGNGAKLEILFPLRDMTGLETNRASIIVRLVYGANEFLLTGDAPQEIETYLVEKYGPQLQSDVLKLGHHGSRTSSGQNFLSTIKPQYAVISAGRDNRYGHPHQEVLVRLKEMNIFTTNTAKQGTIEFISDGKTLECRRCQ